MMFLTQESDLVDRSFIHSLFTAEKTEHLHVKTNAKTSTTRGQSNLTKSASRLGVTPGGRNLYH